MKNIAMKHFLLSFIAIPVILIVETTIGNTLIQQSVLGFKADNSYVFNDKRIIPSVVNYPAQNNCWMANTTDNSSIGSSPCIGSMKVALISESSTDDMTPAMSIAMKSFSLKKLLILSSTNKFN